MTIPDGDGAEHVEEEDEQPASTEPVVQAAFLIRPHRQLTFEEREAVLADMAAQHHIDLQPRHGLLGRVASFMKRRPVACSLAAGIAGAVLGAALTPSPFHSHSRRH